MVPPMLRLVATILWIASANFLLAAPKIAFVQVSEIYLKLESTKDMNLDIEIERSEVFNDPRTSAYRSVLRDLETTRKKLGESQEISQAARRQLVISYDLKRQEALTLKRELDGFRQRRTKEINTKLVSQMKVIRAKIQLAAAQTAQTKGYDLLIDSSGKTNSVLPFVLYSKNPSDITAAVRATLTESGFATVSDTSN